MAELKIAETQARDVQIGQPASVDTHNGVIAGKGQARRSRSAERHRHRGREADRRTAPRGATRPERRRHDRSGKTATTCSTSAVRHSGQENSTISMFKLDPSGKGRGARASEDRARIGEFDPDAEGLQEGDTVILVRHVALGQHGSAVGLT